MGRHSSFHFTGEITKARFVENMNAEGTGIQAVLASVGAFAQNKMTDITKKTDASGRLSDSITWQTVTRGSNIRSRAEEDDKIDKPKSSGDVYIGSGAEHAIYREMGSGVHRHFEGHEKFEELMKEWCRTKYHKPFNPDSGDPKDKALFLHILKVVREGHKPVPFVKPVEPLIMPYAIKEFRKAMNTFFKVGKK